MSTDGVRSFRFREGDRSCRSDDDVHRRRKTTLQTLFKGKVERVDLLEALDEAKVGQAKEITKKCEAFSKQWCLIPDSGRMSMYSFVIAYTHEGSSKEDSPYRVLNRAILDFEPSALTDARLFLYGLLEGLRSLPYMQYSNLYRGLGTRVKWEADDVRTFPTFTSTSRDGDVARACGLILRAATSSSLSLRRSNSVSITA